MDIFLLHIDKEDKWGAKEEDSQTYKVKSTYKKLQNTITRKEEELYEPKPYHESCTWLEERLEIK